MISYGKIAGKSAGGCHGEAVAQRPHEHRKDLWKLILRRQTVVQKGFLILAQRSTTMKPAATKRMTVRTARFIGHLEVVVCSNSAFTDGRIRTMIVNTPSTVPKGMNTQAIQAKTRQNV